MHSIAEQIEAAALQLSPEERARLAERLIASLEETTEIEQAWIEEAERRYERYRTGELKTVPTSEVIAKLRAQLP